MRRKKLSVGLTAVAVVVLTVLCAANRANAQQEKVLHNFINQGDDGFYPLDSLVFDSAGNLYGTTASGNSHGYYGTVFELMPNGSGGWIKKNLHLFSNNGVDGVGPYAGVVFDATGNLYGTTEQGGTYGVGNFAGGTVFELQPAAGGTWIEKVLHNFGSGTDGFNPTGGLVFDAAGHLYGTTYAGGAYGRGTVFELVPTPAGGWSEKVLHSFKNDNADGNYPYSSLAFDTAGNLYGTTAYGGAYACAIDIYGCGTVFEMKPTPGGGWTEKVLHSFTRNGADGVFPRSSLIFDSTGNFYGTTVEGGTGTGCNDGGYGCGTVFEFSPTAGGGWAEKILYSFLDNGQDGYYPYASLVLDASGDLFGTTSTGGSANSFAYGGGTVFELKRTSGSWVEKVLHSFGAGVDAAYPQAGLIFDSSGNLYGTTEFGGPGGYGAAFEIKP
jgi:uncharacterized repeat protein (TIGR03803 family)